MWSDLASTRDAQGTLQCLGFLVEQLAKVAIALRTKAIVGHCHELTIVSRPVAKIDAGDLWHPCPSDISRHRGSTPRYNPFASYNEHRRVVPARVGSPNY